MWSAQLLFLTYFLLLGLTTAFLPSTNSLLRPLGDTNIRKNSPLLDGLVGRECTSVVLAARRKKEDLSSIETRDMTREEMLELNKESANVMKNELGLMTGFSLLVSLPILYLCWVAFFSE